MRDEVFSNISKIIERDSKFATYKFALLRATIDVIQENSPFISFSGEKVIIPTGLLVEKWLQYYYPIMESEVRVPQIGRNNNLAFEKSFLNVVAFYRNGKGGFSTFYNDLRRKGFSDEISETVLLLFKEVADTIIKQPMRYIGRSLSNEYYSIFKIESGKKRNTRNLQPNLDFLIHSFGTFSIPMEYYKAFQFLGSFISGQDSILFKWAEFSHYSSNQTIEITYILDNLLKSPITQRESSESRKIFNSVLAKEGAISCVWTGKGISNYHVEHIIPFAIWKNNDLWNLLPSKASTNNQKRDKIPSPQIITKQKDLIVHYWDVVNKVYPERFEKELRLSLLGHSSLDNWKNVAIDKLKLTCDYLINVRGFEEWKPSHEK
jgi:hypothetical protein